MKKWYSFLEVLSFPLKLLFMAVLFYGLGNILVNDVFSSLFVVKNEYIILIAEALMRISSFFIVYFPFLFLIRLVAKRINGANSILTGLVGYVTFLVFLIFFQEQGLANFAYSATLGISVTSSKLSALSGATRYPLQTGLIGVVIVAICTRLSLRHSKSRLENGFLSFIDKNLYGVLLNILYCGIAGVIVAWTWPYLFRVYTDIVNFIASDTTNPVNLAVYGIMDRVFAVLNLSNLIRQPFWFRSLGGSIMNMVGESVAGDVNIWTSVIRTGGVSAQAGKFITPYYVLNVFAIPGMILAMHTLNTDKLERRKYRTFIILAIIVSMFSGCLLPLEILLLLLCPLLFVFHVLYTAGLFGLFQILGVYLGFQARSNNVLVEAPGTILELISYSQLNSLRDDVMVVCIVGLISFVAYFILTRLYFNVLAYDLFNTGKTDSVAKEMVDALGGSANIKMIYSSCTHITVQLFDPSLLNVRGVQVLGANKLLETRAGFLIDFGAGSRIMAKAMNKVLRKSMR
ncbi:MAG: hypothetical protein MR210_09175 [Erysipelotrichaceae bacterium]|nr:hypothetical protein [Erysipelotrichaceae bacterium]MDY5252975.1 hypothetical protein [Erysipelotrichaceae bacterium]